MSTYKTQGIIIKRNNFGESSLLLNIYTNDFGKIEVVARSARKAKGKLKGHLEIFLLTDLVLANGRNIDTITSSVAIKSFLNLRNNLEISFGAYYLIELVDRMTIERHRDERVFYLLKKVLLFLDGLAEENNSSPVQTPQPPLSGGKSNLLNCLILLFQIHLLNLSGFSPELDKCVACSKPIKPGENYFSFSRGGIIGRECGLRREAERPIGRSASLVPISDNAIKLIRLFQFKKNSEAEKNSPPDKGGWGVKYEFYLNKHFEVINKLKADEKLVSDAVFLMNKFIEFNIEKKVRGVDFIREL